MSAGIILWSIVILIGALLVVFVKRFRQWLASMETAIALLLIVTALSMAGVLIGQKLPSAAYTERFGAALGAFVMRSRLSDVFSSWYFLLFVTALALSIVVCAFARIARLVRTARTVRVAKLGSLITHLSMVVIMAGGLVTAELGFRRPAERYLGEGDEIFVQEGGFTLRVDEARQEFTDDGMVSEFLSLVTVFEDGEEVGSARIEVNAPFVRNGIGVYQYEMLPSATTVASVTLGVAIEAPGGDEQLVELRVPFREEVPVPGTDLSLKALSFLGHFTYDIEQGAAELASIWHENPAVLVQVSEAGLVAGETWVFAGFPAHGMTHELPCRLFLLDYFPDYEHALTRLEFSRQPGTPLLFAGFLAMSLGLMLTFWTRRPRPKAGASDDGKPLDAA